MRKKAMDMHCFLGSSTLLFSRDGDIGFLCIGLVVLERLHVTHKVVEKNYMTREINLFGARPFFGARLNFFGIILVMRHWTR